MVKIVRDTTGRKAALVVLGWIAFVVGSFSNAPLLSVPLMAIARVLP